MGHKMLPPLPTAAQGASSMCLSADTVNTLVETGGEDGRAHAGIKELRTVGGDICLDRCDEAVTLSP